MRAIDSTQARFSDHPLELGVADCLLMARFHLSRMGHKRLPQPPRYRTPIEARRALRAQGVDSLEELLDAHLERIAPAEMLMGDIALVAGDAAGVVAGGDSGGADAAVRETLALCVGQKIWLWHEDHRLPVNLVPFDGAIRAAWRA